MQGSKLIIKNTGILYAKTFITMGIALYSTRLILNALGATDYGLFSLIAGVIAMLTFLNNSLSQATQRFLCFNLGGGQKKKLSEIFNASVFLHLIVGILVVMIVEGFGYFAFENILSIPHDRLYAAKMTFHFMVISTFFTIISVPYDAIINAHEHMLFDSIVGIIQALGILSIAISLQYVTADKLIWYSLFMASLILLLLVIRRIYCRILYKESKVNFKIHLNRVTIKEMLTYSSWTFFTAISSMFSVYGISIVLNAFFGARINASYGIAGQLNGQISVFSTTMLKALNPQIIKSEGSGERNRMVKLAMTGAKMSFFLLSFFAIPFILEAPFILKIWLINPPEYTVIFSRLVLVVAMFSQLSLPIGNIVNAVGNNRKMAIYSSIIFIMVLPVALILFKIGLPPFYVYVIQVGAEICLLFIRVYQANKIADMKIKDYINLVIKPVLIVIMVVIILTSPLSIIIHENFLRLFLTCFISSIGFLISLYYWGLKNEEKQFIKGVLYNMKSKLINR